ncbi:MAG: hypothetical protein IJF96_01730, partial [Firmicutes bacterium]|nr:hypothetical protein [Bacillota bacterium]
MKKMTRTLIAVITILALTFTTSTVFAEDGAAGQAAEKSAVKAEQGAVSSVQAEAPQALESKAFKAAPLDMGGSTIQSTGSIIAKTKAFAATELKWTGLSVKGIGSDRWEYWTLGVKTTGKLWMNVYSDEGSAGAMEVAVGRYNSSTGAITTLGTTDPYLSPGDQTNRLCGIDVTAGKQYVIAVSSDYAGVLAVNPFVIPYKNNRLLKAGRTMISSGYKTKDLKDSAVRYKIRPTKSGYITVALKRYGYDKSAGYVQLLTKGKKTASEKLWYYQGSDTSYVVFGVKKGVTYYLKVTNCSGTYDNCYAYGIRYKIKKSPVRKNTKKRKAVKLYRKGAWKKTVLLGNNR